MRRCRWWRWPLAAACVAVAPVLGGCLHAETRTSEEGAGTSVPPSPPDRSAAVRFAGRRIEGTLYLLVGPDPNFADVYRLRGSPSSARRLTREGRLSTISAQPGRIVVADARGSGSDRVETLDLRKRNALPGRVIDPSGQSPALSASGKVAYVVPQYEPDGGSAGTHLIVSRLDGKARRVVYRSKSDLASPTWLPGDRLAVLRSPEAPGAKLVIDPGRPGQRILDPGFRGAFTLRSTQGGAMFVSGLRKLALIAADGARGKVIDAGALPLSWTPDGRAVLVVRGRELGLLDPRTERVEPLARTSGPEPIDADWVPE